VGLYIRKYVQYGPFRLNRSKSGLGVSVGVPGLRVGSGPRGNYVHMGRYGAFSRPAGARWDGHHDGGVRPRPESFRPGISITSGIRACAVERQASPGGPRGNRHGHY
jgi:Protein of unknown function (DUF4236)